MACAGMQLAEETSTETVYSRDFHGSTRLDVISGRGNRWWSSWPWAIKKTTAVKQGPAREYFSAVILNMSLLLAAIVVTIMIIGTISTLHGTKTTVKKKNAGDILMLLPEKKPPPPLEQIETPMMAKPEMTYTMKKHQTPRPEKMPPKVRIDIPRIDLNANLLTGLDIGITTWHIPPRKSEYGMGEVDQVPMAIFQVQPDYPYHAKRQGTEGIVSIRFLVTREGTVSSFSVLKATPEGIFDEAARRSVLRWKFRPGLKNGEAVNTWVEMDIEFELG